MTASGLYGFEPPDPVRLRDLELREACPASAGAASRVPKPHLERWKSLEQAVVDWHVNGEPESDEAITDTCDRLFGSWDPVQRHMLEGLFAAYRRLHPTDSRVEFEPNPGLFINPTLNLSLQVGVQLEVESDTGCEAVRIKTGRSGTSPVEAAAYYTHNGDKTLVDVMLARDDRVRVPQLDPSEAQELLQALFDRYARAKVQDPGRRPGLHCYSCPRPARCGQYPVIGGEVSYRTRTVRVSKSQLADFARCQRSAAWPALYGIPRDDNVGDDAEDSQGLRVGNAFHKTVAAALLSDHPQILFDAACRNAPPSDATDLRHLFDQHIDLWNNDPHPVAPARTEYHMGVTVRVPGQVVDRQGNLEEGPVAVVMICATDVNGWETDTTPAVVEHRTGIASAPLPHEADLYAVSAWAALQQMRKQSDGVAVHFHHLRHTPTQCQRIHYTPDQVLEATSRLAEVARTVAAWHPSNALSPEYNVGPQCDWCDRKEQCQNHR